ncbi:MAG: RNA-directed DNA polymerase [Planctomycetes bacterium]|nr:RNA-directed DNA polymerase [Planctomycetota bacterium]
MGLSFLKKLFGGSESERPSGKKGKPSQRLPKTTLARYKPKPYVPSLRVKGAKPYPFAQPACPGFLDGRVGEDAARLQRYGLQRLQTPEELAAWLKIPLKTLAWMADYHRTNYLEDVKKKQHYHYKWVKKRSSAGYRLIEAPKPMLKMIQRRIHEEILSKVPPHPAAHGFVAGRSIISNASQHAGKYVILKIDLQDFYPSIKRRRVLAVFRGLGYGVEASHWLMRLCVNCIPSNCDAPDDSSKAFHWIIRGMYVPRHLPQGAPTSPALANFAAWALDVRLAGLAKKFGVTYTRYADDLTFSSDSKLMKGKSMTMLIRYVRGIVKDEGFRWNASKKAVVRRGSRQVVTGLTVNAKPNVARKEFDALKAILHNCAKKGPASQNRSGVADFRAHLQGRIGFVRSVNPPKAARLQKVYEKIAW